MNTYHVGVSVLISLTVIAVYLLMFTNIAEFFNMKAFDDRDSRNRLSPQLLDLLSKVCHLFRHKNLDIWLGWIRSQSNDVKHEALRKILLHFEAKHYEWDHRITPELILNLPIFKGFEDIANNLSRLLKDIKAAPDLHLKNKLQFYKFTIISYITLYPIQALDQIEEEIVELSQPGIMGSSSFEKKKFLLEQLMRFNDHYNTDGVHDNRLVGLLKKFVINPHENRSVKLISFQMFEEFDDSVTRDVILDVFSEFVKNIPELDDDNATILRTLVKECILFIAEPKVFKAFHHVVRNRFANPIVKTTISSMLASHSSLFSSEQLYLIHTLETKGEFELTRALAKKNNLIESEKLFIEEEEPKYVYYEELFKADYIATEDLPIPDFQKEYLDKYLKQISKGTISSASSSEEFGSNTENNINFSGSFFIGANLYDKAYIIRLFACLNNMNFHYLNFTKVVGKDLENAADLLAVELELIKPRTVIYIHAVDELYKIHDSQAEQTALSQAKLHLREYSRKSDFILIGASENPVFSQETHPMTSELHADITYKNIIDFPIPGEYDKMKIFETIVQCLNKKRVLDQEGLINEFLHLGEQQSNLEFYYKIGKYLKVMMLILQEYMSVTPVLKLENKYRPLLKEVFQIYDS